MMKKPGLDVMIAVGKPKPMKGGPAPLMMGKKPASAEMGDEEAEMEEDPMEDVKEASRMDRLEKLLTKIAEAVGVEAEAEEEEDEY